VKIANLKGHKDLRKMMTKRWTALVSAILVFGLGTSFGVRAQEGSPSAPKPEGVVSATVITAQGKIVRVNRARKQVTLELPDGQKVTIDVHNPYNLNAAKVGEPFVARYYEVVTIRKKKPGESIPSASLKSGIATARPGGTPGAVAEMHVQLLVTVDAIDEANGTVTVKAADGTTETVKPRNPQNLKRLKVGDQLVVGISRAIGLTLQKQEGTAAS
jgi:hypothetical protein